MKKIGITSIFLLLMFIVFANPVWAKYVIEERIEIGSIKIDRTVPSLQVNYSTKELTSENVEVTIKSNEIIQEIEGWSLQEDKKILKKEYSENIKEEIHVKDLSGNVTNLIVEVNNIDKESPIIEIQKISNSNTAYTNYANKDAEISVIIQIKDDRKIVKSIEESNVKILTNNNEIMPKVKKITLQKDEEKEKQILLKLSGIQEEGDLKLKILKDSVKDEIGHSSLELNKDLKIKIDNTKPQVTYSQNKVENGKIKAQIIANEKIRKLEGWTTESDTLITKVFASNVSYITEIQDLAGNKSSIEINVIQATNVVLSYASHNSEVGWTYGYGNYDIAGLDAIKRNSKFKTESLAFSINGNINKDFLQVRAFAYTYWGEGGASYCCENGQIYYHGWNPSKTEWDTLLSKENIVLEGNKYIQFGGTGINHSNNTDINGENPIPSQLGNQYKYGISAIQLKLKDNSEYSIVYQIYVDELGWIKPAKNGEIECYKEDKPMSALRIALIPNSEVNALLNTWNLDIR